MEIRCDLVIRSLQTSLLRSVNGWGGSTLGLCTTSSPPFEVMSGRIGKADENGVVAGALATDE